MTHTRRSRLGQAALIGGVSAALLTPFLIYVWGTVQIVSNGYQIEATETRLLSLEQQNRALRLEKARLESFSRIEERARARGLEPLNPSRIVALADRRLGPRRAAPAAGRR